MSRFSFRLRFNLPKGDAIEHSDEELLLAEGDGGFRLRLKSGAAGDPIKAHSRAALIGGPYNGEAEARSAGERAKTALLIWSIRNRVGLDMGDERFRGGLTNAGLEHFSQQFQRPVRDDRIGLDVFDDKEGVLFLAFNTKVNVGRSARAFCDQVTSSFADAPRLTERQVLAAELFCSSFFDVSSRSRFVTLITALEALLEPEERDPGAKEVVQQMTELVGSSPLDKATRMSMMGSLEWLKRQSIGQAGRDLASRFLGSRRYLGTAPPKFFTYCYEIRSEILHSGRPRDPDLDVSRVTAAARDFVADVLLGVCGQPPRAEDDLQSHE